MSALTLTTIRRFPVSRYLLVFLLAGCASTYEHPTKSAADFDREWYECEARFAELVSRDPLYGAYMRERCIKAKGWK